MRGKDFPIVAPRGSEGRSLLFLFSAAFYLSPCFLAKQVGHTNGFLYYFSQPCIRTHRREQLIFGGGFGKSYRSGVSLPAGIGKIVWIRR